MVLKNLRRILVKQRISLFDVESRFLVMVHGLKIAPNYFEKVVSKEKSFEVRYNDRNFQVGDILKLMEYVDGSYTGCSVYAKVTYILQDFEGLRPNFVVLSIELI